MFQVDFLRLEPKQLLFDGTSLASRSIAAGASHISSPYFVRLTETCSRTGPPMNIDDAMSELSLQSLSEIDLQRLTVDMETKQVCWFASEQSIYNNSLHCFVQRTSHRSSQLFSHESNRDQLISCSSSSRALRRNSIAKSRKSKDSLQFVSRGQIMSMISAGTF